MTHDVQRQLRLHRVKVNFEKESMHAQVLKIVDDASPAVQDGDTNVDGSDLLASTASLSFLDIVSSGPESKNRPPLRPFILLGFSHIADDPQSEAQQKTTLSRWELEPAPAGLHPSFDAIAGSKLPVQPEISVGDPRFLAAHTYLFVARLHTQAFARPPCNEYYIDHSTIESEHCSGLVVQ